MEVIPHHLFGKLRIFVVNGVPWFIGRDVATALQYNQPHKAVKRHVSANQKCTYEALHATVAGGTSRTPLTETQPHTIFVNEAGLYSLVLASKLPAAVAFKDWICEDVLPSIRKYGRYSFDQDLRNELQLHNALCGYIRKQFPTLRMSPGLGELQDTDRKRIECYRKGYMKGQPDLILYQRSGNFSGLAIELKTPRGSGIVSEPQHQWLHDMALAGYKTLISCDIDECIRAVNAYMQNARVCCPHCGGSYKSKKTMQTHVAKYHPTF